MKIYINGTLEKSIPMTGPTVASSWNLYIGGQEYGFQNFFDGKIDEVAVWDKALSATEIATLYGNGNGKSIARNNSHDLHRM